MGRERHALFFDLAQPRERKNLKAAGVRENRPLPRHEFVKSAHFLHNLVARAKMQMVRVRKLHLRSDVLQILRGQRALDGRLRADIHKYRRLHCAVRAGKFAPPSSSFCF